MRNSPLSKEKHHEIDMDWGEICVIEIKSIKIHQKNQ